MADSNTGSEDHVIKKPLNLATITRELQAIAYCWHNLGVQLDIDPNVLKQIEFEYRHDGVQRQFIETITYWLKRCQDKSWKKIADALRDINQPQLASQVAQYDHHGAEDTSISHDIIPQQQYQAPSIYNPLPPGATGSQLGQQPYLQSMNVMAPTFNFNPQFGATHTPQSLPIFSTSPWTTPTTMNTIAHTSQVDFRSSLDQGREPSCHNQQIQPFKSAIQMQHHSHLPSALPHHLSHQQLSFFHQESTPTHYHTDSLPPGYYHSQSQTLPRKWDLSQHLVNRGAIAGSCDTGVAMPPPPKVPRLQQESAGTSYGPRDVALHSQQQRMLSSQQQYQTHSRDTTSGLTFHNVGSVPAVDQTTDLSSGVYHHHESFDSELQMQQALSLRQHHVRSPVPHQSCLAPVRYHSRLSNPQSSWPREDHSIQSSVSPVTTQDDSHESCRHKLKEYYSHQLEVPDSTWPPVKASKHVKLALIKSQAINFGNDFGKLSLSGTLNPTDTTALGYVLSRADQSSTPCTELSLKSCRFGPESLDALVKATGDQIQHLEVINFHRTEIKTSMEGGLAEFLKKLKTTRTLDLSHCKLRLQTLSLLQSQSAIPSTLTTLNLGDNSHLSAKSIPVIQSIKDSLPNLKTLEIPWPKMKYGGCLKLLHGVNTGFWANATDIDLQHNNIGDDGAQSLAEGLSHCTNLQTLDLGWNNIGADGAQSLAEGLSHCTNLQTLNLGGNNIGADGARSLAEGLSHCTNLQTLYLDKNFISDEGVEHLTRLIKTAPKMETFYLSDNKFSESGEADLRKAKEERNLNSELCNLMLHISSLSHYLMENSDSDESVATASKERELDNLKHFQAYQLALQQGVNVSIRYFKLLFSGPPRVGKTSARRRLIGEILNLKSARSRNPETKEIEVSSSTGAAESIHVIVQLDEQKHKQTTALLTKDNKWMAIKSFNKRDLDKELDLLYRFIHEATQASESRSIKSPTNQPMLLASHDQTSKPNALISASDSPESHSELKSKSLFSGVEIKLESDDYDTPLMISEAQHSTLVPADSDEMMLSSIQQPSWKETNEKVYNAFNKVLQSKNPSEYLEVLLEGTSLINMIDTGGQPAFLEMLPVLTVGPAMYLVFLNLIQNLKDRYEIRYATEEGDILLNTCSYTIQEVIFQILSSIVAFSRIEGNEIFPDPSQAVLFVGTHKDKLESTASVVEKDKAIQRELKQVLQTDMCNQLLCRASDSDKSLVLAIDNETGDEHEIETMRKRLAEIIESKFKKYDIPATWLMFNLFLRKLVLHDVHENSDSVCSKTNVGVIPLEQCKDIAMELHVTDLEDALWFFHHVVGSLMYFPEVKELEDIVICNPQVVFDSVTTLIIQTFKSDDTASQRFKETGQFSYEDIEKAVRETSSEFLPPAKLICLLEYRNIIAPIEAPPHSKSSKWYFFPAILECATSEQLQKFEQTKEPNDPPPLMIHFKFGFVPMGLFCAVIANLVTQIHSQKLGWLLHCEADTNKSLYKNQLTFRTGPRSFDVTLISLPKRFEVHLTQRQTETDVESTHHTELEVCRAVLESICDTLDKVISQIKLSTKTEEPIYQLGFKCPRHSDRLSDDLVLNKATSDSSRSPKLLWYDFLSNKSCFQCLNSEDELSKNEVFNPKFLNCLSWFGISNLNRLKLLLITEQPESQVKIYGDEVSFKVEVIDTGVETKETDSFQYQWFKDNTEITLETHPYCRGANKSTLHISAILPQYEGNYKCEVRSKDGNIVWSNNATLKVVTQASLLMLNCLERNIGESVMASSPVINHSSQSNFQLLPLVPPSLEVVDYNGKVLLGPDDGIKINIPPGTVPESEVIHVQIQSFVPVSNDAIDLPRGMKLFSPIYHISTFSKKFQKDIQLSMFHYAKLLSRSDTSKLTFLHSTDKTPPYRFTELSGGEFDFDSCSGTIHLQSFCKVAQAGSIGIVEKFMVYFLHPIPTLNSKCMCALFSACYKHSAYLKYLKDEMEGNFPDAKLHPDYEPVELAEGSEHFELIIPHEDVRKQGYTIQLLTRRTTKISVKAVPLPPQESAESAGYPFAFPVPFRLLHVKGLRNCTSVGDLECDLVVSGAKETPEPFVLRACAEAPRSAFGSEKTGTSNKTDAECEYMFADANRYFDKLDRRQIVRLGTELGLGVFSVESMKNLPDDMLRAWFRKEDRVKEVCGDSITWEMLVEALKRIGQNGIADNILKEKCEKQIREDDTSTERSDLQTEPNHKRETRSAATQAAAGSTTSTPQIPSVKNQTQKKSHSMTRLRSRSRSHSRNHPRISLHSHSPRGFVSSRGNYRSPPQRRYRSRSRSSPRHRQDSPLRQSLSRRSRSSSPRDWRRHSMERRDRDRDRRCRSSSQRSQVYTSESSNTSSPQRDKDKDRDGSRKRGRSSPSMKRSKKSKKRHHESSARLRTSTSSLESSSEEPKTKERRKK